MKPSAAALPAETKSGRIEALRSLWRFTLVMAGSGVMEPTDDALLEAYRAGDDAALARLLERYQPAVYRFGTTMCRDAEDARDVLQETLLAAARGARAFRGGSSFATWLYAIARSFCIKHRRRPKGAPATTAVLDDAFEREVPDTGPAPDDAANSRELSAALEAAIRSLEPSYREVLVLRDIEGLSAPEVAAVLGLGVDAVKSRLHRARVAVRSRLAPWWLPGMAPSPATVENGCVDIATLFSRYLEGEISPTECAAMQGHISGCRTCTATCDALKRTLALCRASANAEVPAEIQAQIRRAIREALQKVEPAAPVR